MNAPDLSDEMRRKLEAQAEPITPQKAWRGLRDIALATTYVAVMWLIVVPFGNRLSAQAKMFGIAVFLAFVVITRVVSEFSAWRKRAALIRQGASVPPVSWILGSWAASSLMLVAATCFLLSWTMRARGQPETLLLTTQWSAYIVGIIASAWLAKRAGKRGWVQK